MDRWLTVASPDEADGTELQLALNDNPAAKAYQQALFQQGQPARRPKVRPSTPTAAARDLLLSHVNDPGLPADTRLAIAGRVFRDDRPGSPAERSKQRSRDNKSAREGRERAAGPKAAAPFAVYSRPALVLIASGFKPR
jgi:hypothetical protein